MPQKLSSYRSIVVLTGAGISAESGLATFRDSNGLWENHRVEDVATPEAFDENPLLVWRFYSMRRINAAAAHPNAAHLTLARFARARKEAKLDFFLVTQNVDGLHERAHLEAQSPLPFAMHGTLGISRCTQCEKQYWDDTAYFNLDGKPTLQATGLNAALSTKPTTPSASSLEILDASVLSFSDEKLPLSPCCARLLRPHIVWFGEMPLHMNRIEEELRDCDLFVTIGTSGNVYPAAGFLSAAKRFGAHTVCLNKEPLPQQDSVDECILSPASKTVPAYFEG